MKNKTLISILIFIFLLIFLFLIIKILMYVISPTKAEVESFLEENSCVSQDYCVYYDMRRNTGMLFGQIFKIPAWWVFPNFMLYTTTPFNYYHDITHSEEEHYTYTWVDTIEGRFVYNAVSGEYVKEIDDEVDPAKIWLEHMIKEHEEALKRIENNQDSTSGTNYDCSSNIYNCVNFSTHNEAQAVFEACGGINDDVHHLDGDTDGIACESLP